VARGIWLAIVVVGVVIAISVASFSKFTVVSPRVGAVQCDAPVYGSGHSLSGDAAKACDNEARTRAETGGLVAAGIAVGGLMVGRAIRPRR